MTRTLVVLCLIALVFRSSPAFAQATRPTALPTTSPSAATDDPLAAAVASAYQKLEGLEQSGTLRLDFDAAGSKQQNTYAFTTRFATPAKFVHEVRDQITAVSTGEKTYLYQPAARQYSELPAIAAKAGPLPLPPPLVALLGDQNPSLLMAISGDPLASLRASAGSLRSGPAVDLGGVSHPTLEFTRDDGQVQRLVIEPTTRLVRQVRIDLGETLRRAGVPNVARADVVIDYASTTIDPAFAADAFAWTPPKSARQVGGSDEELLAAREAGPHPLEGKPAPAFTLASLDGNEVSLADLKGKVVVLDFWATWCPPCREGLPHLAKLAAEHAEAAFQLYAVNVREDEAKVKAFLEQNRLKLPVLMDADGGVARQFGVSGIPQTVVIGKDGVVRKVFVGFGPGSGEQIDAAVKAALASP